MADRTSRLQSKVGTPIAMTDDACRLLILQGVGLVLFGALAAALSNATPLAPSALVGWLLLITGLFRLACGLGADVASGHWSSMLLSSLMIAFGASLVFYPRVTGFALTVTLGAYLVAHAAASLVLAASLRRQTGRWIAVLVGGIVDLALAARILAEWPSAPSIPCLYLGLNLGFAGLALMFVAFGKNQHNATPN
jgi:uncharacterized membrane protein HdeD (DUF308 family)